MGAVSETGGSQDVVYVALAHPRSERGVKVREGSFQDVACIAHPLDFPGALAQTRGPQLPGRVEPPNAPREKVDDTRRRWMHRSERIDSDALNVTRPQHAAQHLA